MALVFLFVVASIGFMVEATAGSFGFVTGAALVCFIALAIGVFVGTLIQAKHWEDEA